MHVSLTRVSGNRKVGPIPVSTTEEASCPRSCPLHNTDCYARFGPLGMHWRKVTPGQRGDNWGGFCKRIKKLPRQQLWRHNQAGDLPQTKRKYKIDRIDAKKSFQLSQASAHTKGWTYTHYDPKVKHNADVIRKMNQEDGLTVNLSADSLTEADEYVNLNIGPVVVILPKDSGTSNLKTPEGNHIVVCPAQTNDDMSCDRCRLCQVKTRNSVIGFLAHGTASKRLSLKLESVP